MIRPSLITFFTALLPLFSFSITLHIGNGFPYQNLEQAASDALPGDTILYHEGTYSGGQHIYQLQGTPNAWIYIQNAPGETVIIDGDSKAIQFIEPAYLHVSGLIVQHQTGNGINTDDGGDYETPAHHVIFDNITFRDMSASGNNDLLKLSGLDYFEIRNCTFLNGANGGSGIDMVGCHNGIIEDNYFENMGSNSIQAKGGTEHIRIEGNFFRNGGLRTLNLGGSTGLQFFRPDTAHFEAANLEIYSNIIVGSWAAIAYVGSVNVKVVNNTIYKPENWVIRILQETVDPDRFFECGDNFFQNNIIYLGNNLSTETNIGPNTRPETFTLSNNLWYNFDNPNWNGPNIPVTDANSILNQDPLFTDADNDDFTIPINSPAAGAGISLDDPVLDYLNGGYANPPSIGAVEANPVSRSKDIASVDIGLVKVYPNPATSEVFISFESKSATEIQIELYDSLGRKIDQLWEGKIATGSFSKRFELKLGNGLYFVKIRNKKATFTKALVLY